jgi:hypothetical protein
MFLAENALLPERPSNTSSLFLTMIIVARSDAVAPISAEATKFIARDRDLPAVQSSFGHIP